MNTHSELKKKIQLFCAETGVVPATLSARIFGQWRPLKRFMEGGDITLSKAEIALRWLNENHPTPTQHQKETRV